MPWEGIDNTYQSGDQFHAKHRDPWRFIPADDFFESINCASSGTKQPTSIFYDPSDQFNEGNPNPACQHGRIFRFDNGSFILIQFMRPQVWRLRFHPAYSTAPQFSDYNSRTIVQDRLAEMIHILDIAEKLDWSVEFDDKNPKYYILRSVVRCKDGATNVAVQLWIQRDPFRITATRCIKTPSALKREPLSHSDMPVRIPASSGNAVIWETKERGLQFQEHATILSVEKPPTARYMGFGEQGGKRLFKDNTYMNYFNHDNMRYRNLYDNGPCEDAEPLYHSEPYWIEVNGHPGYMSQVATFVDNYSHVCVDLGKTATNRVRIATRFNSFQCILIAGNDVGEIIRTYTSIIGRPSLKPRFVLGHHQGCFGYDRRWKVEEVVRRYRESGFPLDGMHLDVDIQQQYRTFTIDENRFPEPEKMFKQLRDLGVRCSTNITPVINSEPDAAYTTLNDGLREKRFVLDRRAIDPSAPNAQDQRYQQYGKGSLYFTNPSTLPDFEKSFNSSREFRGGVDYGNGQKAPGYYPNLNDAETRVWWGKQYEYLFNTGLEFVWQDMTGPCMAEIYGDMKSWPFRLLLDCDGWSGDPVYPDDIEPKKAIEIWSLYSYNLHKATFEGLQALKARSGKRNFIIGRGSYAGAQRYAGLWTGDNASTWEFLKISIAQVIALGLSGVTISGADVGGFEPAEGQTEFADPELLIRWYCAYTLLPWFRNHYTGRHEPLESDPTAQRDLDKKLFQEPYKYQDYYEANSWRFTNAHERRIYESVLPVCRYYVRLRYSLLQLLYDAMFENMINGLPIARALVITDPLDGSLFSGNEWFSRSQYMVRNDLLVAPALVQEARCSKRRIYLPTTNSWYPMNLRPRDDDERGGVLTIGEALEHKVEGGTFVSFDCHISPEESHLPYITPMYIREGAIIPQIQVRQFVPDRSSDMPEEPANPITINIYPGKENGDGTTYWMYLDDGVSRSSAPDNLYLASLPDESTGEFSTQLHDAYGDEQAKSNFRRVDISQKIGPTNATNGVATRTISINTHWKGPHYANIPEEERYNDAKVKRDIGPDYRIVIWHDSETLMDTVSLEVQVSGVRWTRFATNVGSSASVVWIPVDCETESEILVSYGRG